MLIINKVNADLFFLKEIKWIQADKRLMNSSMSSIERGMPRSDEKNIPDAKDRAIKRKGKAITRFRFQIAPDGQGSLKEGGTGLLSLREYSFHRD